jgi:hypothetical protein
LRVTVPPPEEPQPAQTTAAAVAASTPAMRDLRTVSPLLQPSGASEDLLPAPSAALTEFGRYPHTSAAVFTISSSFATSWS